MYSKIKFQDDNKEDGSLNTYEIYNMNLNSRMAVLGNCNTTNNLNGKGLGLINLSQAFIYSGCLGIVAPLWGSEDKINNDFLSVFYTYIYKGKRKDEALQLAKLYFIKNKNLHPYYWANHIVIGDARPLY